jgi:hypothetical protein
MASIRHSPINGSRLSSAEPWEMPVAINSFRYLNKEKNS